MSSFIKYACMALFLFLLFFYWFYFICRLCCAIDGISSFSSKNCVLSKIISLFKCQFYFTLNIHENHDSMFAVHSIISVSTCHVWPVNNIKWIFYFYFIHLPNAIYSDTDFGSFAFLFCCVVMCALSSHLNNFQLF